MKKKISIGWLFAIVLLFGSCDRPNYRMWWWDYIYQIDIDYNASACGVDSCVLNIPWLHDKIEQTLADTATFPYIAEDDRWTEKCYSELEIYLYRDTVTGTDYFIEDLGWIAIDSVAVYNCDGYIVEDDECPPSPHWWDLNIVNIRIGWSFVPGLS